MKSQHTTGPWQTSTNEKQEWQVLDSKGDLLAEIFKSGVEDEANANLIAAAPELLTICKEVFQFLYPDIKTLKREGRLNAARNIEAQCVRLNRVISKATGKEI